MSDRAELYRRLPLLEADRWWLELAAASPDGGVLELGAGAGRLTAAFADAGAHVTAIDHDEAMVASLRDHVGADVEVQHAEVTELPDGPRVGLVALPASLLNELPDQSSRRAAIEGAARRCRVDGVVAMELLSPWWLVRLPPRSTGRLVAADGSSDVEVTLDAGAFDVWAGRRRATLTYRFSDGEMFRDEFDAAVVTPAELLDSLAAAGLELVEQGDRLSHAPSLDESSWRVVARFAASHSGRHVAADERVMWRSDHRSGAPTTSGTVRRPRG